MDQQGKEPPGRWREQRMKRKTRRAGNTKVRERNPFQKDEGIYTLSYKIARDESSTIVRRRSKWTCRASTHSTSFQVLNTYYMPGTVLNASFTLSI
jgi:hypothetical protein